MMFGPPWNSRMSRRSLMAGGLALAVAGCSPLGNDDDAEDPTPEPESLEFPEATQAPPTPTQPPIASPVPGYLDPERWFGRSLVVASAGVGEYLDALTAAFFDPFAEATGATVRHQAFGRDGITNLIDQVENEETIWDVVLVPTGAVLPLAQQQYLEPIDYAIVDPSSLYQEAAMQHGVGGMFYSTVMVSATVVDDDPESWGEFWNLDLFAGTRALRRHPIGTLEFALLADGVAAEDLYPIDGPRAFDALDQIRDATTFYEDSKLPVELVRTGQVGLASAWNIRTVLPDVASLVDVHWQNGMISADSWAVPRGADNLDVAMSFINFATRAVPSANFSRYQPFGPANKDAFALLRDDIVESLPTAPQNIDLQFFENWSYWADNGEQLVEQFEDWLLNPIASPEAS